LGIGGANNPKEVVYWAWHAQQQHGGEGQPLESFCATLLAAALFRSDRPDAALRQLRHNTRSGGTAWDWLFLSMARRQAGDARSAGEWLERARAWLAESGPSLPWHQRLELEILSEEARPAVPE